MPLWLLIVLILGSMSALIVLWYQLPKKLASGESASGRTKSEERIRTSLNALITSISVVVGVFVTVYNLQSNRDDQLNQQATTLFVESIKLLGNKDADMSSRAGAVYAIQRVMERDSAFHNAAVSTLVSFIQNNRSRHSNPNCKPKDVRDDAAIDAAFQVIGNRREWIDTERKHILDFSFLCLLGEDFNQLDLAGADFQGSDLRRTSFEGANISGAMFSAADFDYWHVPGIEDKDRTSDGYKQVVDSYRRYQLLSLFTGATAIGTHFEGACLRGVEFAGANLRDAAFSGAGISLAHFDGAKELDQANAFGDTCSAQAPSGLASITEASCARPRAQDKDPPAQDQCDVEYFRGLSSP